MAIHIPWDSCGPNKFELESNQGLVYPNDNTELVSRIWLLMSSHSYKRSLAPLHSWVTDFDCFRMQMEVMLSIQQKLSTSKQQRLFSPKTAHMCSWLTSHRGQTSINHFYFQFRNSNSEYSSKHSVIWWLLWPNQTSSLSLAQVVPVSD